MEAIRQVAKSIPLKGTKALKKRQCAPIHSLYPFRGSNHDVPNCSRRRCFVEFDRLRNHSYLVRPHAGTGGGCGRPRECCRAQAQLPGVQLAQGCLSDEEVGRSYGWILDFSFGGRTEHGHEL